MVKNTSLSNSRIKELISNLYGLTVEQISDMPGGSMKSSVKVEIGGKSYVLSFFDGHEISEVHCLSDLLVSLTGKELIKAPPIPGKNGSTVFDFNGTPVMLKPFIEGEVKRNLTLDDYKLVGEKLGKLNLITDAKGLEGRTSGMPIDEAEMIRNPDLESGKFFRNLSEEETKSVFSQMNSLLERTLPIEERLTALPQALIHGDLFWDNLVKEDSGSIEFIDFDFAGLGVPVVDIGMALLGMCRGEIGLDVEKTEAFMTGYCQTRTLSKDEIENLDGAVLNAAAIVCSSRFVRHNMIFPNEELFDYYKEMLNFIDELDSNSSVFGGFELTTDTI